MPARRSVVSITPPQHHPTPWRACCLRRAPIASCRQLPTSGGIRLVGNKAATLMGSVVTAKRGPGNFGKIFPKFLLHEDPRTSANARPESRTSAGPHAAPTGTVCARSLRGTLASTTPPPGARVRPTSCRPKPSRYRPRIKPRATHEPAADIAARRTHRAMHSVSTWRKTGRVLTITPFSSRRSRRLRCQQWPWSSCSR